MQFYIVIAVICLAKIALAKDRMVTHMPVVPDQHLDQDIQEAIKKSKPSEGCYSGINMTLEDLTVLMTGTRVIAHGMPVQLSPCDLCRFDLLKTIHVPSVEDARVAPYLPNGSIADVFFEFKKVHLSCTGCNLVDDAGTKVTGKIKMVWTGGRAEVVLQMKCNIFSSFDVKILFINATNTNTETLKLDCEGDEAFTNICTETHKSGELDHMIQNGVELTFENGHLRRLMSLVGYNIDVLDSVFFGCCSDDL